MLHDCQHIAQIGVEAIILLFVIIILEHTTVSVMGEGETNNVDYSIQLPMINSKCP